MLVRPASMGMVEHRACLRFTTEANEGFARIAVVTQNPLYGYDAARMALACPIDHSHPTPANLI